MSTASIVVGSGPGQVQLPIGVIADGDLVRRNGTSVEGIAPASVTTGVATYANGVRETGGPTTLTMGAVADTEILTRSGTTIDGVLPSAMTVGVATYANGIRETGGPTTLAMGAVADASIVTRSGATAVGITRQALADALRTIDIAPASAAPVDAATYAWTTAKSASIIYSAGGCVITPPDETDVVNWPVGEARSLLKVNTSANVIGFAALTNIQYNLDTANTAITTLIGSATVPSVATGLPVWTVYRASATLYLIWPGI